MRALCLAGAVGLFVLSGCGSVGGATRVGTGSVRGLVSLRASSRQAATPLAGVSVSCGGVTTVTGSNGTYLLSNVSVGQLTITAAMTGYQPYAGLVSVATDQTMQYDMQLSRVPVATQFGEISGIAVASGSNQPLAGVTVSCGGVSATTAANGSYHLTPVPLGAQTLAAALTAYNSFSTTVTVAAGNQNVPVTLVASGLGTGSLHGLVSLRTTARQTVTPLAGVKVACGGKQVTTGSDGSYTLSALAAGQLTITATKSGCQPYAGLATVVSGQTVQYDMQVSPAAADTSQFGDVSGTVLSAGDAQPLAGVTLSCGGITATSAANGTYKLALVPVGAQTLTAALPAFNSFSTSVNVTHAGQTVPVILVASGGVRIAISPETARLAVNGHWAFGALVRGTTETAVSWSVREAAGGTISSEGLYQAPATPGTYHVVVVSQADIGKSAVATVTVVPAASLLPFNGTRSYGVPAMAGGPLAGTDLALTIASAPTTGRRSRDSAPVDVRVTSGNDYYHNSALLLQQLLDDYISGTLTGSDGSTGTIELRFINGGESLLVVIHFATDESNGTALKTLAVAATATTPGGVFAVRQPVAFGGSALALLPGARIVEYAWDLDGSGTFAETSATTPNLAHTYTQAGTYAATLRVTDSTGGIATDTLNLTVVSGSTTITVQ